jgi:nicotinamide mononucleotide transporter
MSLLEIIGFILTIIGVILASNQTIFTWVISVFSPVIYVVVFYNSKLYADALLQIFFILLAIYGYFKWKNKQLISKSSVRNWLPGEVYFGSAFVLIATILFYFFLKIFTNSDVPLADGFLTSLSILATFYTAKKIIQNWLIWIIADVLYTVLFFYKELYITALLYLILVVLAIYGLIQWKKQIQAF